MDTSTKELVDAFNALRLPSEGLSGCLSNEWHFDLRFIQIEPNPSHIIYFVQPQTRYTHMQRLPLGTPSDQPGLAFFPDTAEEAAPVLAKAILHALMNNMGQEPSAESRPTSISTPWKFTTADRTLAAAVSREFQRLGLSAERLWVVRVSKPSTILVAQDCFTIAYKGHLASIGFPDAFTSIIRTPDSVIFENFTVASPEPDQLESFMRQMRNEEQNQAQLLLDYFMQRQNALPSDGNERDTRAQLDNDESGIDAIKKLYEEKSTTVIRAEADLGDAKAALDYAIRLTVGLGCSRSRKAAHEYLIKAAYSETVSDIVKATAHGMLISWCTGASKNVIRSRYFYAACHHANEAARLCLTVSPPGAPASPAVLWFMKKIFEPFAERYPESYMWYKYAIEAYGAREQQWRHGIKKMAKLRLKNPNRYRCAAPGCSVEADTGSMLSRCAGRCDLDKKPSYCSKSCQKADWPNHKPYCRPGAECSVIDDNEYDIAETAPSSKSNSGALQVPVTLPSGKTILLSSSTMGAEALKNLQNLAIENQAVNYEA
ncbi:hypothetical protein D9613_011188 [Agrocybe pediades]|uniref:MYND-type domain-containing protein n=1 Tax=Agrocybe pediades TaxID=84607 RepID=A0A8H4QLR6_9AGAR|nr:hypothetical protein D9613_011188 [Agrocybe pediades]